MMGLKPTAGLALVIMVAAVIGLGGARVATAHPYLNSSEPGCDGSDPNVILCDDFDDGNWGVTLDNAASTSNDGWYISPQGSNGASPWADCGGAGAVGTACAAKSIGTAGDDGGGWIRGEHGYGPVPDFGGTAGASRYSEVWFRFYFKQSTNYVYNSSQKFITVGDATVGAGGIDIAGIGRNTNVMEACPVYDCNFLTYRNPAAAGGQAAYINQNQGRDLDIAPLRGHWIYMEVHVKLNSFSGSTPNRDGVYEMWLDDCGVSGTSCTGTPTLRARYAPSNGGAVIWTNDPTRRIGKFFADFWGNPSDGGTLWFDQLKASRVGPIGFMGGGANPTPVVVAPSAPANVSIR